MTDTETHTKTYKTTEDTEARKDPQIHTYTDAGESDIDAQSHKLGAQKVAGTQKYFMCTETRVHTCARDSEAGASTRTDTHRYPPTHMQVLGWGGRP